MIIFGDGRDDETIIRSRRDGVLFYIDKSDFNKLKAMMQGFEAALEKGRVSRGEQRTNEALFRQARPEPTVVRADEEDTEANTASNVVNIRIDGEKPQVPTLLRLPFLKQTRINQIVVAACFGHDL